MKIVKNFNEIISLPDEKLEPTNIKNVLARRKKLFCLFLKTFEALSFFIKRRFFVVVVFVVSVLMILKVFYDVIEQLKENHLQ